MEKITGITNFDGVYHQYVIRDQKMIREEVGSKKVILIFFWIRNIRFGLFVMPLGRIWELKIIRI